MNRPARSMYMDIAERVSVDSRLYRVTIAANEKVRQDPELDFDGLSTENYSRNPVVMWAHDAVGRSPSGGLPIGRTISLSKTANGRVVADFEFLRDDPFAQRVKNAWDKGFLRAASISWTPLESLPVEGGGWRDTRSDLLEWSLVSVPADPQALRESHRCMMDALLEEPVSAGAQSSVGLKPAPRTSFPQGTQGEVLSPDDSEDTAGALAALGGAAEETRHAVAIGGTGAFARNESDGITEADLREIQALLGAMKATIVDEKEGS